MRLADSELAVILPAYNEEANIGRVVRELRTRWPGADVIVVNDGSTDGTSQEARAAGAVVLDLPFNLGIGGAVQTGYMYAVGRGYPLVARLDGDGQHDPAALEVLLAPILAGEADLVIGSRYLAPSISPNAYRPTLARRLGIRFFSSLVSLLAGQRFTDATSGLQACTAEVARVCARDFPADYPEVECLAVLARAGYRVREVAVEMRPRLAGRSSITPARSLYFALKVTLVLLLTVLRSQEVRPWKG